MEPPTSRKNVQRSAMIPLTLRENWKIRWVLVVYVEHVQF